MPRKTLPAILIILGLSLFGIALPRFVAAVAATPGDLVIFAFSSQARVSDKAIETLIESRRAALGWSAGPRYHRELGHAARLLAGRLQADDTRVGTQLRLAAAATIDGLAVAPVDPPSWLRLAELQWTMGAEPPAVLASLRASVEVGEFDPVRTRRRVEMVLGLWGELTVADRLLFRSQFRHLWDQDPDALAALAVDSRAFLITVAMLDDAEAVGRLRAMRNDALRRQQ